MSQNLKDLLATAAEMRAVGHPWEAVAKEVNRRVKTCQNWPAKHKDLWDPLYRQVQQRRYESTANECHTYLLGLCRDKDPKVRQPALALWLKHGAAAYGPGGAMAPPPVPPEPASKNAKLVGEMIARADSARERIDQKRAREGKPPATDREFYDEWFEEEMEHVERWRQWQKEDREHPLSEEWYPPDDEADQADQYAALDDDPPPAPNPPPPAPPTAGSQGIVVGMLLLAAALVHSRPTYIQAPAWPEYVRGSVPDANRNDARLVLAEARRERRGGVLPTGSDFRARHELS